MSVLMRFAGRAVTGAGVVALGADTVHFLETGRRTPYTLAWTADQMLVQDGLAVSTDAAGGTGLVGSLPLSLVLLWLGAVFFVLGRPKR